MEMWFSIMLVRDIEKPVLQFTVLQQTVPTYFHHKNFRCVLLKLILLKYSCKVHSAGGSTTNAYCAVKNNGYA